MTAGIFADCVFFLKLNNLSFKEKKHLKRSISSHGGSFSFVLNDKCTHVIASNASSLGSTHLKKIHKHHISLVNLEFIWKCIEEKQLLEEASDFEKPVDVILEKVKSVEHVRSMKNLRPVTNLPDTRDDVFDREYIYEEEDEEEPTSSENTEVAKYCFLQKEREVAVVELLCYKENHSLPFKISTCSGPLDGSQKAYSFYLAKDSEKACERYAWRINDLKNKGFLQKDDAPSQAIPFASDALQKVLLEETINTGTISREVGYFVESIWTDAQGHLSNILSCPVNNISINDVGVAEGILLQMKTSLAAQESASQMWVMMCEFYRLIPHISVSTQEITMELLTKKQELCQLIRDMLNVCETTPSTRYPSSLAKYRALRCRIELLDKNAEEFVRLSKQIVQKNYSNEPIEILNIYQIGRLSETCDFNGNLENVQPLLHATSPRNFVGILSRGLLMPKIITEEMGYNRTDVGNLGSGIYFTDSISTSVKYSEPSSTSGSRLLVVCDVALGKSRKVYKKDYTITEPPGGFHSVHGVRRAHGIESDFEDDEFVVYKRNQIKMAYAVQFRTSRDIVVNLQPNVLSVELEETPEDSVEGLKPLEGSVIDDMCNENNIKGGLQNTQGEQIPLEKIYVKAKVTDLVAQVILFQTYKNSSANPIEAKYVFPLDSTAAVCGFEAFINGKHVVGEVKEKQQARQEYRRAIKEGHGAYLMDQDTPDAFTVSVGNLPPKATVVIKITYLMELELDFGDACNFKIPGAVASWQKDTAIKENTQDTVTKVGVDQDGVPEGCFSLQMSIELPYKIDRIQCHTHKILTKKTDCKAVIQTMEGSSLSDAGFQLLIAMENPYVPRMWVERHPEKDSEACMLVFQPEFPNTCEAGDVTICLDCSNSMKPCFQNAQLLALYLASSVFSRGERNVVLFGSSYKEFEFYPRRNLRKTEELEKFIKTAKPNMGGTEFWKPLHSLGLLPRNTGLHNIILISDGHLQNERHIIQFLKKNVGKIRLFTCGVGATANRHSLRRLALLGNGTFDFFDAKTKSKWKDQMQSLYIKLSNNRCTGVTLKWTRHNQPDEEPSQAPAKLPPIFSHGRLIVYGFIRHCTQATLKGLIEDKEMETMVSTTELQKTTGTMLHKLTARALIRDYEDGILHEEEDGNEMQKQLRKSEIINLSKEYSIVTQFTSFIAVEKRDADEQQDVEPNVLEIVSAENVDFLPYMSWEEESDEEVKKERASRICKSDNLSKSDEDDAESQSSDGPLFDLFGSLDGACSESHKRDHDESYDSPTSYDDAHPVEHGEVEDDQEILMELDAHHDETIVYECAGSFSISPQEDLKATLGSRSLKKKKMSVASSTPSAPLAAPAPSLDQLPSSAVGVSLEHLLPPSPARSLQHLLPLPIATTSLQHLSPPPPPFTKDGASWKPPPGVTRMEYSWTPAPPPPPPVAAEEQLSRRPMFKSRMVNVQEDAPLFSQGYALPLPAAPAAPMGFGSSTGAILGPKPSEQAIHRGKKSSETLDSGSALDQPISYSQIKLAPIVSEPEVHHFLAPKYSPFSPSFRPSVPPQREGAALFGSSAGGLSRETGLQQVHMFSHKSIFSRSMPSHPTSFIQEMPTGGQPPAALKEDGRRHRTRVRLCGRREIPAVKRTPPSWADLSALQTTEGFWMLTPELGKILEINVPFLTEVFLMKKGIVSLGNRGKADVCGLIATLLVLQAIRLHNLLNSINFKSLLKLDESSGTSEYYQNIENAIKWARKVEQQYPGVCVRLGLGKDWDFVTKQLLRFEPLETSSELQPALEII